MEIMKNYKLGGVEHWPEVSHTVIALVTWGFDAWIKQWKGVLGSLFSGDGPYFRNPLFPYPVPLSPFGNCQVLILSRAHSHSVSISPSLHLSISPSLHLSISPSLHLSISPSLHLSISPSLHLSISPSLHLRCFDLPSSFSVFPAHFVTFVYLRIIYCLQQLHDLHIPVSSQLLTFL